MKRVNLHREPQKNGANLFLSVTSWKIKQQILMQFSLLELTMNDTCDGMNFTHLT